ncbi:MAG: LLM class flavin-dependent oxidoreductase [Candidatus Bathyarchaeia archaeon]
MKFGVSLSPVLWWKNTAELEKWVLEAESCGYDSIFIPDHYNLTSPSPVGEPLDAWSTLSYIAAITRNIKLGTIVSPIPRYVPSQLAKIVSTVDLLSNGRVLLGVGSGWIPYEFINYSPQQCYEEPKTRVDRFQEGLQIIVKLWTEEKTSFNGKYYKLKDAVLLPKPIQKPHPPLWSGVREKRAMKITAKHCNGWIVPQIRVGPLETAPGKYEAKVLSTVTPEIYEENVNIIKNYLKKFGKSIDKFTLSFFGLVTEKPTENIKTIEKYMQVGCQYYIVDTLRSLSPQMLPSCRAYVEWLRKFAKEVLPSF